MAFPAYSLPTRNPPMLLCRFSSRSCQLVRQCVSFALLPFSQASAFLSRLLVPGCHITRGVFFSADDRSSTASPRSTNAGAGNPRPTKVCSIFLLCKIYPIDSFLTIRDMVIRICIYQLKVCWFGSTPLSFFVFFAYLHSSE